MHDVGAVGQLGHHETADVVKTGGFLDQVLMICVIRIPKVNEHLHEHAEMKDFKNIITVFKFLLCLIANGTTPLGQLAMIRYFSCS